jgi:hypothetical protein
VTEWLQHDQFSDGLQCGWFGEVEDVLEKCESCAGGRIFFTQKKQVRRSLAPI